MLLSVPFLSTFSNRIINLGGGLVFCCLSPFSVPFLILELTWMVSCILLSIPILSTFYDPRIDLWNHILFIQIGLVCH